MSLIVMAEIISAVFLAVTLVSQFVERNNEKSAQVLAVNSVVVLFWLLIDIASYLTGLSYVPTLLAFTMGSVALFCFTYYCDAFISEITELSPWVFRVPKIVSAACALMAIASFVMGRVVAYEDGIATAIYGLPAFVQIAMTLAVLYNLVVIVIYRKAIKLHGILLLSLFNLSPFIAMFLSVPTGYDFTVVFSAFSVVVIFAGVEQERRKIRQTEFVARQAREQDSARLFALEDDFESLYDVELESGHYVSYVRGDFYQGNVIDKLVEPTDYFEDLRANIDAVIYPADRDGLYNTLTREAIRRQLVAADHSDYRYRINTDAGPMWFRIRIVYKDEEKKSVIIGVFNAEEEMAAREKEAELLRTKELELRHSEFRASALAYLTEHEEDITSFLNFFAAELRELVACDQVIYRDANGAMYTKNAPELGEAYSVPIEVCRNCSHYDIFSSAYSKGVVEMSDTKADLGAIPVHKDCPVKSALTRIVYLDGKATGYLTIHYILGYHEFSDYERQTLEEFTNLLSLSLSRYAARAQNAQLSEELELKRQVEEQKEQLERDMQMISGVASGYNALYYINIDEDVLHIYALDEAKYPGSRAIFEGDEPDFYKIIGGYGLSEQVHPDDRHLFADFGPEWFREVLAGRKKYSMRFRAATADGYRWDEMELTKYEGIDEVANAVAVGFTDRDADIRKEQEYQQQLEAAREAADAANKSKSDFLFSMSHDIRTPMNAITGFTAMAKKYADDGERVGDYLDKIDVSGKQLLSLVNQVLEMARIESGQIELDEKPVNVKREFDAMATVLSEQAQANGQRLACSLLDVEHFDVFADESRMSSITLNIAGNAMKYTPEGGSIEFILREVPARKPGYATFAFTVADTGIGMSEEFQKVLFEPFAREKSSTVSKIQGTGLGLPIVKRVVDLMGGDIEVHSELGCGTRFDITVDFRINDDAGTEAVEPTIDILSSFKGLRVLLVEDNELNREIALDILEEEGLLAEEAEDGSVAVELLRQKGPNYYDFILMDIQMPKMNGYEATRAIRELYPDAALPIIALSANAFAEDKQKSLEAGMDAHVAKPIDVDELFTALARFL